MADVARTLGVTSRVGQSPFAIARGKTFEAALFADGAERLRRALVERGVLPPQASGLLDLRLREDGGPLPSLDGARDGFAAFLVRLVEGDDAIRAAGPWLLAGAAVALPGAALSGLLAIDALAVVPSPSPGPVSLVVGEIKVYPDRGGYTDPSELAQARAQAGLYVFALRRALARLRSSERVRVADEGFLVLTRPGSNLPSVRVGEDLRWQAARAEAAFARLEEEAARAGAERGDLAAEVAAAPTAYDPACLAFCELAERCYRKAMAEGEGVVLGRDVGRLLGRISLERAVELLSGEPPRSEAETDLLRRAGYPVGGGEVWRSEHG